MQHSGITIRRALPSDTGTTRELYNGLYPEERHRKERFHLMRTGAETLLAYHNKEPAGFIMLSYVSYGPGPKGFGYIEEMFVRKRYRHLGIGRMLVQAAEEWFEKRGYITLFLTTPRTNKGAILFYRRLGFRKSRQVWMTRAAEQRKQS